MVVRSADVRAEEGAISYGLEMTPVASGLEMVAGLILGFAVIGGKTWWKMRLRTSRGMPSRVNVD